jgi:2,3-bisphosphoglycerate-independent phosphoglycerate mutase
MKYIIIVIDGAADYRITKLGRKTPLQFAKTPNLDSIALSSEMGTARTVPEGMAPGSDVANLSVLGYDPKKYHTGRAPLEAASMGINLQEKDVAFRCNLVTLSDEDNYMERTMIDYSAGEIPTDKSRILIRDVKNKLQTREIKFYPGVSYRHIIVWSGGPDRNTLTPPHDITGKKIADFLPRGPGDEVLLGMMIKSSSLLESHIINKKREKEGLRPANSIWIWGEGKKPELDSFYGKYSLRGSIISAVDLIKGIGVLAGLEPVTVEGATGTIDTNFSGKADAAINQLIAGKDFVFIHLEAADECSHQGDAENKVKAIEIIDRKVIKVIKREMDKEELDYKIMILPDHYTPIRKKTHSSEPVPFLIYDSTRPASGSKKRFDEFKARETGLHFEQGYKLIDYFFGKEE